MDPFARLTLAMIHRRWIVLITTIVVVVGGMIFFGSKANDVVLPGGLVAVGSASDHAATTIEQHFGINEDNLALVVFQSPPKSSTGTVHNPAFKAQVLAAERIVRAQPRVVRIITPYNSSDPSLVSRDGRTAIMQVLLQGGEGQVQTVVANLPDKLNSITLPHYTSGRPAVHGDTLKVSEEDLHRAEFVTIPVVLILLLLVFRTVIAALIPLLLGISAIAVTESAVDIIGSHTDVSVYALNVASIIGLGLGIDFSLIIINRYRLELARHPDVVDAIVATMTTAGRSITYSGLTVILSMALLTIIMLPLAIVRSMSMAVMIIAIVALLGALTLLPALLALLGHHIDSLHVLPRRRPSENTTGFWYRLSRQIMARPILWLLASLVMLGIIASPVRDIVVAGPAVSALPSDVSSVKGTSVIARAFGKGYVAPIQVVINGGPNSIWRPGVLAGIQWLTAELQADRRQVAGVQSLATIEQKAGIPAGAPPAALRAAIRTHPALAAAAARVATLNDGTTTLINIVPTEDEYNAQTEALVQDLRSRYLPAIAGFTGLSVNVGGQTAEFIDFRDAVYGRFPAVIAGILILVFLILAMFFQSVFLPVKAVVMNILSIVATYGALVAIFVWGWGDSLLGFHAAGYLNVVTPVFLFTILFALSTDYEVFMLSRVKEFYEATGDNTEAVASGLQHTAGVITAAGLILMFTFGSFATAQLVTVKEIGIGLAVGVALDTTIVRVIMVPATMRLTGAWNWYMPAWMKRVLPELREGPAPAPAAPTPSEAREAHPPSPTGAPVGYLVPVGGSCGTDRIALTGAHPLRIGRDTTNDLQLFDRRIAGHHARLDYHNGVVFLTDFGRRHGILLNGEKVEPHQRVPLKPGDRLQLDGLDSHAFAVESHADRAS